MNTMKKGSYVQTYWLILAVISVMLALVCWFVTDKKMLYQTETPIEVQAIEEVTPEKVTANRALGAFLNEVRPLELTKRKIALNNNHLAEFRGTAFFQKNAKMWTVELFRAKDEAVVISYFRHHSNQADLYYTRLSGDDQEDTYMVFYKTFKTQSSAQQMLAELTSLGLPASVTPNVQQLKNYVNLVNEVGSDEGMSGYTKVNEIRLSAVPTNNTSYSSTQTTSYPSPRTTMPAVVEPARRIVQHSPEVLQQSGR